MAIIVNPPIYGSFVGESPTTGILFARTPAGANVALASYDPATGLATLPQPIVVQPAAVNAALTALALVNASSGSAAQAVATIATATVSGALAATNVAPVGMVLLTTTAHRLAFGTSGVVRAWIDAGGAFIVGATDVGGTESVRVLAGLRVGGRLVLGQATILTEVLASPIGSRLTFFGDGAGWEMRWARQSSYAGTATDVMRLTDTGVLTPIADASGGLGAQAVRWGALWTSAAHVGAVVTGLSDQLIVGGTSYLGGAARVFVAHATALDVTNPGTGSRYLRVDTIAGVIYAGWQFAVSPAENIAVALFAVNPPSQRVDVGIGYAVGSVPLIVNGTVSAQSQYLLNGVVALSRAGGWTVLLADDGRTGMETSNAANGYRNVYLADSHELYDHAGATPLVTVDTSAGAVLTSLSVRHNGVLKRVQADVPDSAGAGNRRLFIAN